MVRQFFVFVHRWAGLAMTLFLIIVGLTGSALAFREELDIWLNPELLTVAKRDAPLLDGFTLREKAAALYPDASFDLVQLHIEPDRSAPFVHMPGMHAGTDNMMEKMVEFYLDPYTGEKLGERPIWSGPTLERKNLMSFLYSLHFSLAAAVELGKRRRKQRRRLYSRRRRARLDDRLLRRLLSHLPVALAGVDSDASRPANSWWSRWKPAWLIKLNAGAYRINFDIHRAFGLWTWAMLFVFAWSSVAFNLGEVYAPTMKLLFGAPEESATAPTPMKPVEIPALGFREAYARGADLLRAEAERRHVTIERENSLSLDRDGGAYTLSTRSSADVTKAGATSVSFDADTGALRSTSFPGDPPPQNLGDKITSWLIWLHVAAVFGLPMQIIVCVMGLVITALAVTGVYIWWKKRRARKISPRHAMRLSYIPQRIASTPGCVQISSRQEWRSA